ncbi:MAG: ribose 5-phosphate isomerase B [Anaerolineae bacterium]
MRIALGADHAGFGLKQALLEYLTAQGHTVQDFGASDDSTSDYPDFAEPVARAVAAGDVDRGILLCGNGVGMSLAANKVPGVRAVLCSDPYTARTSRTDDDTQVLCLGQRVVGMGLAREIVDVWLATEFSGAERHRRRLEKVSAMDAGPPHSPGC